MMPTIVCAPGDDNFRCPTKWEIWRALMSILVPGRAYQTHEDVADVRYGDETSEVGEFEVNHTGVGAERSFQQLTCLQQWWAAPAAALEFLYQRACALLEEFFCATVRELEPEWMIDYGLPDPCDPYGSLCDKMRAQGGARCADMAEIALRRGYTIVCQDCGGATVAAAADCVAADCAVDRQCRPGEMWITVVSSLSPAITAPATPTMVADLAPADCHSECGPLLNSLICLIERVRPAHIAAHYEVV